MVDDTTGCGHHDVRMSPQGCLLYLVGETTNDKASTEDANGLFFNGEHALDQVRQRKKAIRNVRKLGQLLDHRMTLDGQLTSGSQDEHTRGQYPEARGKGIKNVTMRTIRYLYAVPFVAVDETLQDGKHKGRCLA